jgi:hypothetical protein
LNPFFAVRGLLADHPGGNFHLVLSWFSVFAASSWSNPSCHSVPCFQGRRVGGLPQKTHHHQKSKSVEFNEIRRQFLFPSPRNLGRWRRGSPNQELVKLGRVDSPPWPTVEVLGDVDGWKFAAANPARILAGLIASRAAMAGGVSIFAGVSAITAIYVRARGERAPDSCLTNEKSPARDGFAWQAKPGTNWACTIGRDYACHAGRRISESHW